MLIVVYFFTWIVTIFGFPKLAADLAQGVIEITKLSIRIRHIKLKTLLNGSEVYI